MCGDNPMFNCSILLLECRHFVTTRFLFALGGEIILTDIWCYFFIDGAETNIKEKLEIIRSIVSLSEPNDIALYNYWAKKEGIELIKEDRDS